MGLDGLHAWDPVRRALPTRSGGRGRLVHVPRVLRRRQRRGRHGVIVAPSELDLATAPELALLLADRSVVALDLSRVTFIDASGVRVLLAGVTRAELPLQLRSPSPAVRRVLELAALSDLVSPHAA